MGLKEIIDRWKKGGPLINIDFGQLRQLFRDGKIKISLFSNNKVEIHHHYDESTKTLHVNTNEIIKNAAQKKEFKDTLRYEIDAEYTIIDEKSENTVLDYKEEEKSSFFKKVVEFFKDKISPQDLEIIKAALYVRRCFERGEGIEGLKEGIRQRHGKRGNNIANLCTSSYFENYLMPVYEHLVKISESERDAQEEFNNVFNTMAEELPISVFMCHKMSADEVKKQIINKVENNSKYGVRFLNIHGIGTHNIKTIQSTVAELEKTRDFKKNIKLDEKRQIISVRLEL